MSLSIRSSGVLLPVFSLPGTVFLGGLGRFARRFADDLADMRQTWWQLLPINPVDDCHSPYSSRSAFAGETLYIDLEDLYQQGLLDASDLEEHWFASDNFPSGKYADYEAALKSRFVCWQKAFERFQRHLGGAKFRERQEAFQAKNQDWLEDTVLFQALSEHFRTADWSRWPTEIRRRFPDAVREIRQELSDKTEFLEFLQLVFDTQWMEHREYCHSRKIQLIGDVPIYVGKSSADTWLHPELFQMDPDGFMLRNSGVPADSFNPEGQRWNSPLYRWEEHEKTGFAWWIHRLRKTLERFDAVRLDHFIGFYNYYSFPSDINEPQETEKYVAPNGQVYEPGWRPGPQEKFFDAVFRVCPSDAFFVEDLGVMNPGVHALRNHYHLPGNCVLEFSFDWRDEGDPTAQWPQHSVACTGTHDTPPVLAWLAGLEKMGPHHKKPVHFLPVWYALLKHQKEEEKVVMDFDNHPEYNGEEWGYWRFSVPESEPKDQTENVEQGISEVSAPIRDDIVALRKPAIRAVMSAASHLALFPVQDLLGLGADARINFPGYPQGNWRWRLLPGQLTEERKNEFRELTEENSRAVL